MTRLATVALLVFTFLCSGMTHAQQRWQQLPLHEPYDNIDALLQLEALHDLPWESVAGEFPNTGLSGGGYWYRSTLPTPVQERQVLWIRNGIYSSLDVYLVNDGVVQWYREGATSDTRSLFDDVFLLGEPDCAYERYKLYLRATPAGVLQLPADLIDETRMLALKEQQDFALGAVLGVLLILSAYFFVLYLIVRDRGFLFYVLHSVSAALLIALWHGLDRAIWWPSIMSPTPMLILIMSLVVMTCMLLLTLWFLRLQERDEPIARLLRGLRNASLILALATSALPQGFVIICIVMLAVLVSVAISLALMRYGNFRDLGVRLFTLGWICFIPSITAVSMYRLGYIELITELGTLASGGWILEMVLQAFALVVRYDTDQRDKLAAQQQAIAARERESAARSQALHHEQQARRALEEAEQAQRDHAHTLEQRVKQRRDELEHIHQELAAITVTDALTGLHNRRFFTERFDQEVARMQHLDAGLSLMLIDVDYFKRINDTYGHLAGDECLQQVAARLKAQLKRPSDVLCRYGGEEFAVLLPDTPLPGALAFAHAICDSITATPVQCEGVAINVSISVGLIVTETGTTLTADQLLHRTDQALYRAKQDGRNCVRVAQ